MLVCQYNVILIPVTLYNKRTLIMASDLNEIIKMQFNIQAQKFSNWSVTRNDEYHRDYFEFCGINTKDRLLDVACGTGEFALFCAPKVKSVVGIDISQGMIDVANRQAKDQHIANVQFICHEVENIPLESDQFSIVVSKSAFHHFSAYDAVIGEMIRCCTKGGRISIQDIVVYENDNLNNYFEELEKLIDISHHKCVSKDFVVKLFEKNQLAIEKKFELEVDINFKEYIKHAIQSEENQKKIEQLLKMGLNDPEISKNFIIKDDELFFKRNVFLILGKKN
jgi:ubiquinone/menaquinone biosynthesis C-methylase UbiE